MLNLKNSINSKVLINFLYVVLSVLGGIMIGIVYPGFSTSLGAIGQSILNITRLCVIPLLVTSILLSSSNFLLKSRHLNLPKALLTFGGLFFCISCLGVIWSFVVQSGVKLHLDSNVQMNYQLIASSIVTRTIDQRIVNDTEHTLWEFFGHLIPTNLFHAMVFDHYFQVLLGSLLMGWAASSIEAQKHRMFKDLLQSVSDVFSKIFSFTIKIFPLALMFITASDVAIVGLEVVSQMIYFLLGILSGFVLLFIASICIISYKLKISLAQVMLLLKEPLFIVFTTRSGIAAVSSVIKFFSQGSYLAPQSHSMLTAISLVVSQCGVIFHFAFTSIFVAQIYHHDLVMFPFNEMADLIYIILMSVMVSFATIGMSGSLMLPMMSIVIEPLGMSLSSCLMLLIVIDPFIEPFRSATSLHLNVAALVLADRPESQQDSLNAQASK